MWDKHWMLLPKAEHTERCSVRENDSWLRGVSQIRVIYTQNCPGSRPVPDVELQLSERLRVGDAPCAESKGQSGAEGKVQRNKTTIKTSSEAVVLPKAGLQTLQRLVLCRQDAARTTMCRTAASWRSPRGSRTEPSRKPGRP